MIKTIIIFLLVVYIIISVIYYLIAMVLLDHILQQDDVSIKDDEILCDEDDHQLYENIKNIVKCNGLKMTLIEFSIITLFTAFGWPLAMILRYKNK